MYENFGPFNHTASNLSPNMIFDVTYSDDALQLVLTYACISDSLFSFNVLAKSNAFSLEDIEELVAAADLETGGLLNVEEIRYSDQASYHKCGMA